MLRRPLHTTLRHTALIQPRTRPILHSFPTQTRSVRTVFYKNPNPLWFVLTATVSFFSFFFIVKKRRGLGTTPSPSFLSRRGACANTVDRSNESEPYRRCEERGRT